MKTWDTALTADGSDALVLVLSARPLCCAHILWHHIWSCSLYYSNLSGTPSFICQMSRFTLRFVRRGHISGNISFRYPIWCWRLLLCSFAKKAVFGCMLSIRNRRECPSSSSNLSFCTLAEMQKRLFCFVAGADNLRLPKSSNCTGMSGWRWHWDSLTTQ